MKSIEEFRRELHDVAPENPLPTVDKIRSRARGHRRRMIAAVAGTALLVFAVAVGIPVLTNQQPANQDVVPAAPNGTFAEPGPQVAAPAFVPAKVDVPTTIEQALRIAGGPSKLTAKPQVTERGPTVDLGGGFYAWVMPPEPGVFGLPESAMENPPAGAEPPQVCIQLPDSINGEAGCFPGELNVRGPGVVLAGFRMSHLNKYFVWVVGPISSVVLDADGQQIPVKLYNLGYNTGLVVATGVPNPTATINMNDEDPLKNAQMLTLRAFDDNGRLVAKS